MLLYPASKLGDKLQPRVALVGPQKSNISLLMRYFIHKVLDASEYNVFWVNAKSEEDIEKSFDTIVNRMDIHPKVTTSSELIHYLTWQIKTQWIMVFDGLQRQSALYLVSQQRLPQGMKGALIFTVTAEEKSCLALLQPSKSLIVPRSEWLEIKPSGGRFDLQAKIYGARQRTYDETGLSKTFLPNNETHRLINHAAVAHELSMHTTDINLAQQIQKYTKAICGVHEVEIHGEKKITTFRKIFALLVLIEAVPSIVDFLREEVTDQDLPLVKREQDGMLYRKGGRICVPPGCFREWSPLKLENFQSYQWWLLAPYFSSPENDGVLENHKLQDQHVLPFLPPGDALSQSIVKTGGYGRVVMMNIHSDHHNFSDKRLCERGFVVKQQLHDENRDAYKREIYMLMNFSGGRSHPHMVSLLATYEQFNRFNLIFYRAEGDLFDYWKSLQPHPALNHSNTNWFAKQCSGLAQGLSRLHKLQSVIQWQPKIEEEQVKDIHGALTRSKE